MKMQMPIKSPYQPQKEDFFIKEIVLTHDPDDDRQLDSEMLLNLVESILFHTTQNVFDATDNCYIDLSEAEEPISLIICKMSNEILSCCFGDENLHRKTLFLLEKLSPYRWDAKVVVALASFAGNFGLFWLILQLQSDNALALSLAIVKKLPSNITVMKPKFKALNLLVITMLKLTRVIVSFEGMTLHHELVDDEVMDVAKSKIYMATYWIFRGILVCSSQIADSGNLRLEQVCSDKAVIAAWGLHSIGNKLNSLCNDLEVYTDKCQQQIETRLYDNLLHMFKGNQVDNQKALRILLNGLPLKNASSNEVCGILELKSKVVLLLISKPELLPIDKVFWLVQQICNHPEQTETEGISYAIIWIPVSSSHEWGRADKTSFEFLSNRLPWFSIQRPWSLNPTVVNYVKQEWDFKKDPIMVVLNENGMITNSNAMDMVWVWGIKAYPFSVSREKELWEDANWTIDLMINGISPLLTELVKEDKNICIYGSDSIDWVREFIVTMNKIKSAAGIQLEVVYVGCKNSGENVRTIIDTIDQEKLCISLTLNKMHFFWFRLETIKRCIVQQNHMTSTDKIATKDELMELKCWAVIGRGSSVDVVILDSEKLKECVELFPLWCKNVGQMGLVGAIRSALEPPSGDAKCHHNELIPYGEGFVEKRLICASCKRPIERFVVYECDE